MYCLVGVLLLSGAQAYSPGPSKLLANSGGGGNGVKYQWSTVDFKYSDPARKGDDIAAGHYAPDSVVILDVDAYIGPNGVKREFVTTPNLLPGTPFTLSEITNKKGEGGGQILKPFPNEQWHHKGDCDSITSPFRIKIDKRGRMWVMDTGKINVFTAPQKVCDPQILAFDLNKNNTLIKRYRIPADQITPLTLLVNLDVEVQQDDTWVYAVDPVTYRMIVYSLKKDSSHSFVHPYFYPDALYGFYNLNGVNFTLMDGILAVAVSPDQKDPKVYFHSLSSGREGLVRSSVLKDPRRATTNSNELRISSDERGSHSTVQVVTRSGVVIFADLEDNALYGWDTRTQFLPRNFRPLVKNRQTLQFVTGMKIVGDDLYVISSRLQNAIAGVLEKGALNYRVLVFNLDRLLSMSMGNS